ncbi:calcium/sodium antiporter [Emericellopsis cladophorae]|uniref:Calcium/sodium antiporter n=1 Tax=Emericellopsis cladophorae TaxID=2686198 RepID=A0A9P9Y4L9_9HYPO|nr:calcium/sodium antiporter [Emericellopsis cladophorae]KAI6783331.1 calcium/sodium antiporter [Emericellopsis cladophorae]
MFVPFNHEHFPGPRESVFCQVTMAESATAHTSVGQGQQHDNGTICAVDLHDEPSSVETAKKPGYLRTIYLTVHHVLTYNPLINILYVFVAAGIIVAQFPSVPGGMVFGLNCVAVIPLAALLAHATESFTGEMGDALGALINVTVGNAVELIIFIALTKNEIRIVQASLLGSLLANLLLILGLAFFLGGMRYREQLYNNTVTQMSACLLSLSVVSLVLPTAFHVSFEDYHRAGEQSLKISRGTSTVLLVVYVIFLVFQLKTHAYLYESMPKHIVDAEAAPGPVAGWLDNDDDENVPHEDSGIDSDDTRVNMRHRMRRATSKSKRRNMSPTLGPGLGSRTSSQTIVDDDDALPRTREGEGEGGKDATELKIEEKRSKSPRDRRRRRRCRNAEGEDTVEIGGDARQGHQRTASGPSQLELRLPSSEIAPWTPKSPFVRFKSFAPVLFHETDPSDTRRHSQMAQNADVPGRSDNRCPSRLSVATVTDGVAKTMADDEKGPEEFEMSRIGALVVLLLAATLVATCAEFLISSIEAVTASSPLSDTFIGLIVLPIVGNATEHITAIRGAMRNKMDLAIGVAIGSSIQLALLITPLVVLLGWLLDKPMGLYFTLFETVCLFVSAFIVNFLVLDGKSNFMEGVLLCAVYLVIGIVAFFYPEGNEGNEGSHWGVGEGDVSF